MTFWNRKPEIDLSHKKIICEHVILTKIVNDVYGCESCEEEFDLVGLNDL